MKLTIFIGSVFQCGADFVKVNQQGYVGIEPEVGRRYASLDGDADRLIYFYYDEDMKFHMLDGDKIAVLIADYLGELLKASKIDITLGLVQTAYANGSSTNYMKDVLVGKFIDCARNTDLTCLHFSLGPACDLHSNWGEAFTSRSSKI